MQFYLHHNPGFIMTFIFYFIFVTCLHVSLFFIIQSYLPILITLTIKWFVLLTCFLIFSIAVLFWYIMGATLFWRAQVPLLSKLYFIHIFKVILYIYLKLYPKFIYIYIYIYIIYIYIYRAKKKSQIKEVIKDQRRKNSYLFDFQPCLFW